MPRKEVNIEDLAYQAMQVLSDYFETPSKAKDPEKARAARVASSVLSTWATVRQADNNERALKLALLREMDSGNPQIKAQARLMLKEV